MILSFIERIHSGIDDANKALLDSNQVVTYLQLRNMVTKLALSLTENDIGPRDRVALFGANDVESVAAYLAVLTLGATVVPIPTATSRDECQRVIAITTPKCLLLGPALAQPDRTKILSPENITVLPLTAANPAENNDSALFIEPVSSPSDVPAALMFTSGSSGTPRLVTTTIGNLQANTQAIISTLGIRRKDRAFVALPLSYCFAASVLHTHLQVGSSIYLYRGAFQPHRLAAELRSSEATTLPLVPSMISGLVNRRALNTDEFPRLRVIQQAGGYLPSTIEQEFRRRLPNIKLYRMYGQTEATARISVLQPLYLDEKAGSAGLPLPGLEVQIVRQASTDLEGEVKVRGASITAGYWGDPVATADRFERDGWLRTRDTGFLDEDGFLYITGRYDGTLKVGGVRVSAQLIEEVLCAHPKVLVAAVTSVSHKDQVEVLAAMVEPLDESTGQLNEGEIRYWCNGRLLRQFIPSLVLIQKIPLTLNGKIDRRAVARRAISRIKDGLA